MKGLRCVQDLNRNELDELKQAYLFECSEKDGGARFPSWGELADASEIPDDVILNHYKNVIFSEDDFFCNCGAEPESGKDSEGSAGAPCDNQMQRRKSDEKLQC